MTKFTAQEVSFLRHHVEDAIRKERKTIKCYEDGFKRDAYKDDEKEYNKYVLANAKQKMDDLYTLLSKIDRL